MKALQRRLVYNGGENKLKEAMQRFHIINDQNLKNYRFAPGNDFKPKGLSPCSRR